MEKLRLCKSFDELRVGMVIVTTPCARCSGAHRGVLMPGNDRYTKWPDGTREPPPNFLKIPAASCAARTRNAVTARAVREGRIYIVDDGLDLQADREQARIDKLASDRLSESHRRSPVMR